MNNDHFLYWGEVIKTSEEGADYQFSVIEQTEFIDDASFQPFKGEFLLSCLLDCSHFFLCNIHTLFGLLIRKLCIAWCCTCWD